MRHVLALETPNGAIATFSSPIPWGPGGPTPTRNGRTLSEGFTVLDATRIQFDAPPREGDVVGFFVSGFVTALQ